MGDQDGTLCGYRGRHLPQLLAKLSQVLPPPRCRVYRAQAGNPTDSFPHAGDHQSHYFPEGSADTRRAILRYEDAELHCLENRRDSPDLLPISRRRARDQGLLLGVRPRHRSLRQGNGHQEMTVFEILLPAFVASLILTGIHAYLGVHVVERGVIFVDLSLAQIAALGTTVAYLAGYDLHGTTAYLFSLGFTFLGAAVFAFSRVHRQTRIPQEAVIGIVYAVSAAIAILVMSKATQETEHLKEMLVGNILSVTSASLAKTAVLYSLVGAFHYVFRDRFLLISMDEPEAERRGLNIRFWDFLFYVSFGFVVTSSVAIAGVLLVFCFLIVPSVTAMLFAARLGPRLAIGWTMGALVSAGGVALSFVLDLPTGAAIVATFGLALLLLAGVRRAFFKPIAADTLAEASAERRAIRS